MRFYVPQIHHMTCSLNIHSLIHNVFIYLQMYSDSHFTTSNLTGPGRDSNLKFNPYLTENALCCFLMYHHVSLVYGINRCVF
jgi:hypothetical protein